MKSPWKPKKQKTNISPTHTQFACCSNGIFCVIKQYHLYWHCTKGPHGTSARKSGWKSELKTKARAFVSDDYARECLQYRARWLSSIVRRPDDAPLCWTVCAIWTEKRRQCKQQQVLNGPFDKPQMLGCRQQWHLWRRTQRHSWLHDITDHINVRLSFTHQHSFIQQFKIACVLCCLSNICTFDILLCENGWSLGVGDKIISGRTRALNKKTEYKRLRQSLFYY